MKKSLVFVAVAWTWILLSGSMAIQLPGMPFRPLRFAPSPELHFNQKVKKIHEPAFLSRFETQWRSERLLKTSA